jgi:arylsulfate sulfotransferase
MRVFRGVFAFSVLLSLLCMQALNAQIQVAVHPTVASPQPVGTEVVLYFTATDTNSNPGVLNYKLEVAPPSSTTFTTVRDFEESARFAWTQNLVEGIYQLRVTARDSNYPTETSQVVVRYGITSRITGSQPVVSATSHPLVALFSAPSCTTGKSMQVVFQQVGGTVAAFNTTFSACNGKTSMNILIGGMLPSTEYSFYSQVGVPGGALTNGPTVTWTSGAIPTSLLSVPLTFPVPFNAASSHKERLTLIGFNTAGTPTATTTIGNIVWYYNGDGAYPGDYTGTGLYGNQIGPGQVIQTIDLTGHVIQETNVDRINEQLLAMGTDPVSEFTHDIRLLPNGDLIAIGETQKIFPAGTQGNSDPIDIIGTELVELNSDFQVDWYWDSYDHSTGNGQLNINRAAVLNEQCTTGNGGIDGCPPVLLTNPANDWLHTNTVQYMPEDGSLIISMRNQDWIAKIDYNNAAGTGDILWIMGEDGSFAINNTTGDPWPWFSHQHDVEFQNNSNQLMTMFDNGNTRITSNGGDSRGYVLSVDESGLQVTPQLLADVGFYAVAQGSAQVLTNGDYEFMGGQIYGLEPSSTPLFYQEGVELTPAGATTFSEMAQSAAYRLWRTQDLYHVPTN